MKYSAKSDFLADVKAGVKPGSAKDNALDKKRGVSTKETMVTKANVGKSPVQNLSAGKMQASGPVSLGTVHGKHDVAHPVRGK